MSQHDDRPDAPQPDEAQTSTPEEVDNPVGDASAAVTEDPDEVDVPAGDPAGDVPAGDPAGDVPAGHPAGGVPADDAPAGDPAAGDDFLDAPLIAESGHADAEGDLAALGVDEEDRARLGAGTDPEALGTGPGVSDPAADPGQPLAPGSGQDHDRPGSQTRGAGMVIGLVLLILVALLGAVYLMSRGGDEGPAVTLDGATEDTDDDTDDEGGEGDIEVPAYAVFEEETSREELRDRLEGMVDAEVLDALGDQDAAPEQQGQLAQAISTLITLDVLDHAAEEEGVEVTDADVETQLEEVVATGFGGDQEAFDAQLEQAGVTLEMVRAQFRTALLAEGLVADDVPVIEEEEIRAAYDAQYNLPNVSHILTETEEEAQAAKDRIDAGEDFAAVASEVSTDPGSGAQGGELGPLTPGQFVPEFEEAALALDAGEVSDPVESQFGFHIITVDEPVPFEEVAGQIEEGLQQQGMGDTFTALAERLEAEADITVDPALGTWAGLTGGGLIPPGAGTQPSEGPPPTPEDS